MREIKRDMETNKGDNEKKRVNKNE